MADNAKDRAAPWSTVYKDEVEAAEGGVLFPPGYVPQKGKPLTMPVLDLDPPGQPHWLSKAAQRRAEDKARHSARRREDRRRAREAKR